MKIMKTTRATLLAAAMVLLASTAAPVRAADTAPGAKAVIEHVTQAALAVLRDKSLSATERRQKTRQIAFDSMDFNVLSRLAMGRYWRNLTDAQRAEFVVEFKKRVAGTYGHTSDEYTDEDIKVAADRQESDGDWTVQTKIIGTKDGTRQEIAKVDYRLRQKDSQWKIIDVTIDNVSLAMNFRSQFQDIMNNGGFDQLMKVLREKNASDEK
jgi:phospholipid transport system substrate-binding protein